MTARGAHDHGTPLMAARGAHDHGATLVTAHGAHDHGTPMMAACDSPDAPLMTADSALDSLHHHSEDGIPW